jgi:hypothetical protein
MSGSFEAWIREQFREQYHDELCTFGPPQERKPIWIVKFEDANRGEAHFDNENEAIDFYLQASNSWNCTLLTTVRIGVKNHEV